MINIAYIPPVLDAVMQLSGVEPDFAPRGSLAIEPRIANDQELTLPANLGHGRDSDQILT